MKKICLVLISFLLIPFLWAQEEDSQEQVLSVETELAADSKFYLLYDGGFCLNSVTRIQKESGHNNYVWQDSLLGTFFAARTKNMPVLDAVVRIEVLYPFVHQFNGMQQYSKQTVLYAFDLFTGPYWQWNLCKYVRLNVNPGIHYMYQLSDEYHLNYLGIGTIIGTEFPVSKRWTVLLDGTFSYDDANLGSNRNVQNFDLSWQWQTTLGFRYSRKHTNW